MKKNYAKAIVAQIVGDRTNVETPPSPAIPNADDIVCASAAADLFGVPHQVTGSHLNRVAILFAQVREKTAREAIAKGTT